LAPVFVFWNRNVPTSSFFFSVIGGIAIGGMHALGILPEVVQIGEGKYAALLGANLYGTLLCTGLYFLPALFSKND